jgi:hypothetical protein
MVTTTTQPTIRFRTLLSPLAVLAIFGVVDLWPAKRWAFAGLGCLEPPTEGEISALAGLLESRMWSTGDEIMREEEPGTSMPLIAEWLLEVSVEEHPGTSDGLAGQILCRIRSIFGTR